MKHHTARKVSVFGVFLVRIFQDLHRIRTRETLNGETFYAVSVNEIS